jgi:large subunit ribosomal protein L23
MIRNPKLPPTFASFIVPLNLNKLDLRDYLWNAYGIPVVGVRSYIQQQKIRQDKPGVERIAPRRWFRPRSIKKMTVEMARPFVWPPEPTGEALEKYVPIILPQQ